MKFFSLQSGSNGNCQLIESKNKIILVDSGISGVRTRKLMEEEGFDISNVLGVLITHEHTDHASSAGILARKFKIPIYANKKTFEGAMCRIKNVEDDFIRIIDGSFCVQDFNIVPFKTFHDANDPCGFVVESEGKRITILTDTGRVDDNIIEITKNSDIIYVEANFDPIMLKNGPYSSALQARVRGKEGHLSNFETAEYLLNAVGKKTKFIMIGHISYQNNNEMLAKLTVENELIKYGIDVPIFISSRFRKSVVLEI